MNTLSVRKGPVQRPTAIGRWGQLDRAQGKLIDLDNKVNDEKDEARMHILVEGLPICISVGKRQPCSKQFTYERILSNVLENVVNARQRSAPDQSEIVLESPVRSGYLPPSASNRDRDRLALLRKLIKTGPDRY